MLTLPEPESNSLAPDLTALIDVLFIILVFLLLSVAVKVNVIDINLPNVSDTAEQQIEQSPHVISISMNGDKILYTLDEQPYSAQHTLLQAFDKIVDHKPVYIAVEDQIPSEELIQFLSQLSNQGIEVANLIVERE